MPPSATFPIKVNFRVNKELNSMINALLKEYGFSSKAELLRNIIFKEAKFAGLLDYEKSRRSKESPLTL